MVASVHPRIPAPLSWRAVLLACSLAIFALWGAGLVHDVQLARNPEAEKIWLLDADAEVGALTWVSILLLFSSAVLLFLNGQDALAAGRPAVPWFGLATVFALLSFDEFAALHERAELVFVNRFGGSEQFFFIWAVSAGVVALLGFLILRPFVRSLDRHTRALTLVAAAAYLVGALGVDVLTGLVAHGWAKNGLAYRALANAEEVLEMAAVLVLIHTLLARREAAARA